MLIDLRQLWNEDIKPPPGLEMRMDRLFQAQPGSLIPITLRNFKVEQDYPPLFLYLEERAPKNDFAIQAYYGGGGSKGAIIEMSASRSILNLRLGSSRITNKERGEILGAFCKLEFIVDVLTAVTFGVFSDVNTYDELKELYRDDTDILGKLSTFTAKIRYLLAEKRITKTTYSVLFKAKDIRNALAHQYLPIGNYGLSDKDLQRYGGIIKAIDYIFDGSWYYLLRDYNNSQLEVAKWLEEKVVVA